MQTGVLEILHGDLWQVVLAQVLEKWIYYGELSHVFSYLPTRTPILFHWEYDWAKCDSFISIDLIFVSFFRKCSRTLPWELGMGMGQNWEKQSRLPWQWQTGAYWSIISLICNPTSTFTRLPFCIDHANNDTFCEQMGHWKTFHWQCFYKFPRLMRMPLSWALYSFLFEL